MISVVRFSVLWCAYLSLHVCVCLFMSRIAYIQFYLRTCSTSTPVNDVLYLLFTQVSVPTVCLCVCVGLKEFLFVTTMRYIIGPPLATLFSLARFFVYNFLFTTHHINQLNSLFFWACVCVLPYYSTPTLGGAGWLWVNRRTERLRPLKSDEITLRTGL